MRSLLGTLAALLGGLLAASAASAEAKGWDSYGPGPKDMKLEKIQFTASSLMFSPSKASVAFGLEIESRTDTPIWVKVAIQGPQSEPVCEQVVAISGKHTATIACARDSIAPDADYPMTVRVFEDSTLTTAVEEGSTQLKFRKKDLDEMDALRTSATLPRVYENVVYKKKFGVGAAMFGQLGPPSEGTLTVSPEGVEWKAKKQAVSVPAAQIRDVGMKSLGPRATDAWVVVEYMEGDASKTMALQPSAFRGKGPTEVGLIYTSIRALFERK